MTTEELRQLRDELGLTQQEMAKSLNVSFVTYSRWENGHRDIPADTAKLLDGIRLLMTSDVRKKTKLTLADITEAVKSVGVQGVIATAAIRKMLPVTLVASLAIMPAYAWLAGAAGLVGLGALSFFKKSKTSDSEEAIKTSENDREHLA